VRKKVDAALTNVHQDSTTESHGKQVMKIIVRAGLALMLTETGVAKSMLGVTHMSHRLDMS
jgi:hypothetical protein